MIAIGRLLLSEDIISEKFVCNLTACKGACCVEGDSGAPLSKEEVKILKTEWSNIRNFLSSEGIETIEKIGVAAKDGKVMKTALTPKGPCVFAVFDKTGTASCGIEKAYQAGKTNFQKPISCHLYPIRVKTNNEIDLLNYETWDICSAACSNGKKLKVPVYRFLKTALIRKYGEDIYEAIEAAAKHIHPSS